MKTVLLFCFLSCLLTSPLRAQSADPPRTALIMGVGDYGQKAAEGQRTTFKGRPVQDLPGIISADLPKMESKLKSLGFTVTTVANPTLTQAKQAVDAFSARIKANPGVSLFYFSGHGGEYEGQNYLIPRRANISSKADLAQEALSAQRVLNGMEESGAEVNLVFLDCCREDMGKSVGGAEMAPLKARGSFIGFATRSGDFADPEEQGSPYTRFLLKHLDTPGISVADMYAKVTGDVKTYSKKVLGEERRPGFYSELDAPFYFAPVVARVAPVPSSVKPPQPPAPQPEPSAPAGLRPGQVVEILLPGKVPMKFCWCPPGRFIMGSPRSEEGRQEDENQVEVTLTKGFWMAQMECKQTQWEAIMSTNPSGTKGKELPVYNVSWSQAQEYISKLKGKVTFPEALDLTEWVFDLPTGAQWEYACRAGTTTAYSFGTAISPEIVNHKHFRQQEPQPPDGYLANPWGLSHMHGNVSEWCSDGWSVNNLGNGQTDPVIPTINGFKMIRGGSGGSKAEDCRSAAKGTFEEKFRSLNTGFRLILVPSK